jgi:glycosyltransferase involved in cell wall biosynthesis
MEKIKIVHISETFVSGVYTYIKQLSSYSESNGNFKTYIIYSGERIETDEAQIKEDFSPNAELIRIDMTREISFFRDIKSFFQIVRQIRRIKPDVIHVHSSKAGVLGRVARIFYPKATLYYTPNGYSFIREDISKTKKAIYAFVEKSITKIFGGTIIACGDHEFSEAKKIGKAILIRNGVDINLVSKFQKPFSNQKLTIGTSGRIYCQKNPDSFNQIAQSLPDYNFVWIGDGDLKNKLSAPNITITGWSTYEGTLKAVNGLDIFISTSSWEGLPFSIIEAMTLSKPIVSSNIEGNKVTVNQNENGFICATLEEFVSGIKKLEDTELRSRFGKESFKIADTIFNMDKNIVDIIKVYSQVKQH